MNALRKLGTAAAVTLGLIALSAAPADAAQHPDISTEAVYIGPGQAAADRQLTDAVKAIAPWMFA